MEHRERNIPLAVFIVAQALFIVVMVSLVSLFNKDGKIGNVDYERQPSIAIEGLVDELPDTPNYFVNSLERTLAKTIELNMDTFDAVGTRAEVRQGTLQVHHFERLEGYYYSAIIDIPNLRQSYQVYDHYPAADSPPNSAPSNMRYVLCLDNQEDVIYPDFRCKDGYSSNVRLKIAGYYVKYFGFDYFTAFADSSDLSLININPINFDVDTATKNSYIAEVKDAISSLGISPDLFTYKVLQQSDLDYNIPPRNQ